MTEMDETKKWYVVQTHPNSEAKAIAHLQRQGFKAYLPRYLKRRRYARRVEMVAAPLFPRYLFVSIDLATQRWLSIHSTVGVARLLCNGSAPTPIGEEVIETLKREEDQLGFVKLQARTKFASGDRIKVFDGVFCASIGLFESSTDEERVSVLLDLLGRKVRVVLDSGLVAAA
jgi:transcriptional antiterminator RfaH